MQNVYNWMAENVGPDDSRALSSILIADKMGISLKEATDATEDLRMNKHLLSADAVEGVGQEGWNDTLTSGEIVYWVNPKPVALRGGGSLPPSLFTFPRW